MQLPTPFRDKSKLLPRLSRPQYPTAPHQQPRTPFGSPQGAQAAAAAVTVAVAVAVAQRHSRISTWSLDGRFGHRRELILFDNPYLCKTNCHWCANDQNSWQLQVGTWKLEGRCYCCWKFAVRSLCVSFCVAVIFVPFVVVKFPNHCAFPSHRDRDRDSRCFTLLWSALAYTLSIRGIVLCSSGMRHSRCSVQCLDSQGAAELGNFRGIFGRLLLEATSYRMSLSISFQSLRDLISPSARIDSL